MKDRTPAPPRAGLFFEALLAFTLFFVAIIFHPFFPEASETPKELALRFLFLAALFLLLARPGSIEWKKLASAPTAWLALGYLGVIAASTLTALDVNTALLRGEELTVPVLFFYLFVLVRSRERFLEWSIGSLLLAGVLVSMYAVLQYAHLDPIPWAHPTRRVFSTLGHADALAAFLAAPLGLALGRLLGGGSSPEPLRFSWFAMLLCSVALLLTFTRGGWVAFGVQLIAWGLLLRRTPSIDRSARLGRAVLVGIVVLLAIAVVAWRPPPRTTVGTRLLSIADVTDESVRTRLYLWQTAARILQAHPWLGVGPGNFSFAHLLAREDAPESLLVRVAFPGSSHNEFLDVGASLGGIGLLLYLALWIRFFTTGLTLIRRSPERHPASGSILLAGVGLFVNSLFIFTSAATQLLFWWLWGIMELLRAREAPAVPNSPRRWWPRLLCLGALVVAAVVWVLFPLLGKYADAKGQRAYGAGRLREALEAFGKALYYDPLNPTLREARGMIFEKTGSEGKGEQWFVRARDDYQEAIRRSPANPRHHASLGRVCGLAWERYRKEEWYACAEEGYLGAIARDPYSPIFRHDMGVALMHGPKWPQAEHSLRACLALAPAYASCAVLLGRGYLDHGDPDKALFVLRGRAGGPSPDPEAVFWYASALLKKGWREEATKFLRDHLRRRPDDESLEKLLEEIEGGVTR